MSDSPKADASVQDTDMPDDALGLGLDLSPETSMPATGGDGAAYRVLARKYRPQNFAELIGQDAMVQTLGNAIKRDRLAHAFLMTGVRGVGKTSTARLIAKALNCIGPDGQGGPTINPCGKCEPCMAIADGRHIDVIEMDAASHTGVDDVREIIEAVRYSAVSARYKIYIIDEVHMLSKNAFNALLKTLEEPPAHVKFLFATTEVNKVPITVLSRCQRFDLKRITVDLLAGHFSEIVQKENIKAEDEALMLIAQAAEGSVRDGLSILDQAIAHADLDGDAIVTADQVRNMLGLSDRGAVRRLFGLILAGDASAMLAEARSQYIMGVEPIAMMVGLLAEVHRITLTKIGTPHDGALDPQATEMVKNWGDQLSFPVLHRLWQLLLKGHDEVARAAMPLECADMALLRVVHGASMPDPGELARMLEKNSANMGGDVVLGAQVAEPASPTSAGIRTAEPQQVHGLPTDFSAMLDQLAAANFLALESTLRDVMRIVEFAPPKIVYQLSGNVTPGFPSELHAALRQITGQSWTLEEGQGEAAPSIFEIEKAQVEDNRRIILESPLVKAVFDAFPEAELLEDGDQDVIRSLSA